MFSKCVVTMPWYICGLYMYIQPNRKVFHISTSKGNSRNWMLFLKWFFLWVSNYFMSLDIRLRHGVLVKCLCFSVFMVPICVHTCIYRRPCRNGNGLNVELTEFALKSGSKEFYHSSNQVIIWIESCARHWHSFKNLTCDNP